MALGVVNGLSSSSQQLPGMPALGWPTSTLPFQPTGRSHRLRIQAAAAPQGVHRQPVQVGQAGSAQQQQERQQQQKRRARDGPLPPALVNKPFLVRVAGLTSSIQGVAGALVKRLRTDDVVRVGAIDAGSVHKAMVALTVANFMVAANNGQMLVFQPALVKTSAEAPKLPQGSLVMYTSQIMQGEVMATNFLAVMGTTDPQKLAGAIAARIRAHSHTVLECYGSKAVGVALKALVQARGFLLAANQDCACIIASGRKADAGSDGSAEAEAAAAAAAGTDAAGAAAAGPSSVTSSRYAPTCHRLVVMECQPRRPRAVLARATMGMTDRVAYANGGGQAPAAATAPADVDTPAV